jgi:hypothetical protein
LGQTIGITSDALKLKTDEDTEASVQLFNDKIQCSGWNAMPEQTDTFKAYDCPKLIKQTIEGKRRIRRDWHQS